MEKKEKFTLNVSKKDKKLNLDLNVSQEFTIPSTRDLLLIISVISIVLMFTYGIIDFDKLVDLLSILL